MSTPAQREAVARIVTEIMAETLKGKLSGRDFVGEIIAAHEAAAPTGLTNARFAQIAAYTAKKAAAWAGDSLMLPEQWAEPIRAADALRFTAEIRQMLDYIDKAIEPPKDPSS